MEPKVNYLVVGGFVVGLGVVLVGLVLWLGQGYDRTVYDQYYAYMEESVTGLNVNASVKYRGVEVGRVKEIVLNPENPEQVRLTLEIARGTPIKQDTVAILDVQGLTGLAIVDLTGGTREAPPLVAQPGQELPVIQTGPSLLVRFDRAVTRLLTNLNRITEDIDALVEEKNRAAMSQLLSDLTTVTHALAGRRGAIEKGLTNAASTLENLARVTRTMNAQVPVLLEHMNRSVATLEGMSQTVTDTSTALKKVIQTTEPRLERFSRDTLTEAGELVTELRELTATLQRVARQVEQEPSSLLFGRSSESRGPGE